MIILHFSTMINIASNIFNDIERIDFHEFEKDFLFIVNGEIYQTNSFVANILSQNISKNYKEKVKTSYYEINTKHTLIKLLNMVK